ncbi:MAG: formate--tetrahydrofolate ligase [Deltaproteobacteria bacterium]|nr:formate--tetrahydrofolate ligase [Deltaproteobacteria bacterium]
MRPITDVAAELGLTPDDLVLHGPWMAKVRLGAVRALAARGAAGRIVLVSAINPTPFGEGKTTVAIGLAQGMRRLGNRVALALREPSLGPVFGIKGGGTGGGRSTVEPSQRINLHFTGDLHAVTAAHNLLAAMIDNAVNFRAEIDLEHRQVLWRRVLDMNDRFLRRTVIGLGGRAHGVPREDGFDITAASEVMAILCLARDVADLKARLARILVGFDRGGAAVSAGRLGASGAMAALLADAVLPNLVQSAEGVPALVHGGPFGNIAHGCNSVIATRTAAAAADYVVTEAGFGFDLGAEKFFDIKCRAAGVWPRAVVLVVTTRALKRHGGDREAKSGGAEGVAAIERGLANLDRHVASVRAFGFEPVIAINRFASDAEDELATIERACTERGLRVARAAPFDGGGEGCEVLAARVVEACAAPAALPRFLYALEDDPLDKIAAVARTIYGAADVSLSRTATNDLARARDLGYGGLPICIAKTQSSLTDDPTRVGGPSGFTLHVEQVRIAAGAGYLLPLTGEIVTMPGLPKRPHALDVDLTEDGEIVGIS